MEDFTRRCLYPMTAPVPTKGYHVLLDYHKHYSWAVADSKQDVDNLVTIPYKIKDGQDEVYDFVSQAITALNILDRASNVRKISLVKSSIGKNSHKN